MEINFGKRDMIWLVLVVVLLGGGFVFALNSGDYQIMGHDSGEVMVNIDGVNKTLQAAVDAGDFKGDEGVKMTSGTYFGDRTVNRPIAHGLGGVPKLVIITSSGGYYHRIHEGRAEIYSERGTYSYKWTTLVPDSTNFYVGRTSEYSQTANTNLDYNWVAFG